MKKIAIALALTMMLLPAFAACSNGEAATAELPPVSEESAPPVAEEQPPSVEENEPQEQESPQHPQENDPDQPVTMPEVPAAAQYLKITAGSLNVRKGAGTGYSSLGTLEKNVLLQYGGKAGEWYETRYLNQKAFIHSAYAEIVTLEKGSAEVERVIEEGLNVLGTPYVYGATRLHDGRGNLLKGFSTAKFDCSSLMQYIFYKGADRLLDVTTRTQILQGREVTEIKRGDLLFFTNASRKNNTGLERVGHVALYLGDNYILHTASDYAKIEQISSTRWSYFIAARRML